MGEVSKYLPQCLNCGTPLSPSDDYCSQCGQRTRGSKVPLKDLISDFFKDYLALDAKFFKSIALLLVRPGELTKRFNAGKRVRYIAPFRMYIFTSFIYFFLLAISMNQDDGSGSGSIYESKAALLDSLLASNNQNINAENARYLVDSIEMSYLEKGIISFDDSQIEDANEESFDAFEAYLIEKATRANRNQKAFIQSMVRAASIVLFFLLPVFALLLWAFHFRKAPYYVQNLVHSVHLHTFVFAVMSIYLVLSFIRDSAFLAILIPISAMYLVWSMKSVYRQSIWVVLIKSFFVIMLYFIVIVLSVIPVIFGALATF